jgi:hypothetical protein
MGQLLFLSCIPATVLHLLRNQDLLLHLLLLLLLLLPLLPASLHPVL